MKIAFLCHPYHRGGVTRWMVDFAISCSKRKYEVYFVVVQPKASFVSASGKETIVSLLNEYRNEIKVITQKVGFEYEFGTMKYRSHVNAKLIMDSVPVNTPVILSDDHAVWNTSMQLGDRYPFIGVLHADDTLYYNHAKRYAEFISSFVCVSKRIQQKLLEDTPGINPNRVFTIPCGIMLPPNEVIEKAKPIINLIYVGRIDEHQKRTSDLISIANSLRDKNSSFHLDIVGEGPQLYELQRRSETEKLDKHITFHGWLDKSSIYEKLRVSDILLLPSNFEGMPIAVMEALACGCGVIATRVSGVEDCEHLPTAKNCMSLYETGKVDEALDKIDSLCSISPVVRKADARILAENEFSMEICMERYSGVIVNSESNDIKKIYFKFVASDFLYSYALSILRRLKLKLS